MLASFHIVCIHTQKKCVERRTITKSKVEATNSYKRLHRLRFTRENEETAQGERHGTKRIFEETFLGAYKQL